MIKDVDKLKDTDLLVVDLTAREAHLITALPLIIYHLQHPATPAEDIATHGLEYTHVKAHAFNIVSRCIEDGTMENVMNKLSRAMEVAVYLRKQR